MADRKLSDEVERLKKLLEEALLHSSKNRNDESIHQNGLETSQVRSGEVSADYSGRMTRKRSREMAEAEKGNVSPVHVPNKVSVRASAEGSFKETFSCKDHSNDQQVYLQPYEFSF